MQSYPSSPRSPGGLRTTSSRSRLSVKTSALLGNRPLVALPVVQLRTAVAPAHEAADTFRKVRFNNATQVVPSLGDVDSVDDWGWTPLMHAAEQNHKQMHVKRLLAAGCDAVRQTLRQRAPWPPPLPYVSRMHEACPNSARRIA
jgi:ankyrin repeat protein